MDNLPNIVIVMPAYNAAKTLQRTYDEIPPAYRKEIILVDDYSSDNTVEVAQNLGIKVICHPKNRGYGANQKTCYQTALADGADIIVMVHPDHQYDATVIPHLVEPLISGSADAAFGSRMLGGHPKGGGIPSKSDCQSVLNVTCSRMVNLYAPGIGMNYASTFPLSTKITG